MSWLKLLVLVSAAILAIAAVAVVFSTTESRYRCAGAFVGDDEDADATVHVKLVEYRWWVSLSSDGADAAMWVEAPRGTSRYLPSVYRLGDGFNIEQPIGGQQRFSQLSGAIQVETYEGFFRGTCERFAP